MENNSKEVTVNNVTVYTARAQKVLAWLIQREAENVRTRERSESKMISDIQKRIEEEAQCY
jgi:hypothetical protein